MTYRSIIIIQQLMTIVHCAVYNFALLYQHNFTDFLLQQVKYNDLERQTQIMLC